ncbi:hypothetical protein ACVISU_008151 [Bradyrhizobium sp. USDA 4452]
MLALWWWDFWVDLVDCALTSAMDEYCRLEFEAVVAGLA